MKLNAELTLQAQLLAIAGQPGPVAEIEGGEGITSKSWPAAGRSIGQEVERASMVCAGMWSVMEWIHVLMSTDLRQIDGVGEGGMESSSVVKCVSMMPASLDRSSPCH